MLDLFFVHCFKLSKYFSKAFLAKPLVSLLSSSLTSDASLGIDLRSKAVTFVYSDCVFVMFSPVIISAGGKKIPANHKLNCDYSDEFNI